MRLPLQEYVNSSKLLRRGNWMYKRELNLMLDHEQITGLDVLIQKLTLAEMRVGQDSCKSGHEYDS